MLADLRGRLFDHLQRLSLGFYERNRAGVIISRLTNDVEALDQLVTDGVTTLVQNTLLLVGTAVVLFFLNWRLALAALVIMPVMAFSTAWFRKRSGRAYRSVRETLGAVTATLAEDIAGMRVLQSFTRERAARENFRAVSNRYRDSNMQTVVLSGIYFPVVDFISSVATAVVLGYGSYLAFNHEMTIGVLIAFLAYLTNFFDPVQQLSQLYNTFLSAVAALDKITDLLDEEPEVRDAAGAVELARIEGHVAFDDVRFAYGRGPEVLHGIDLEVQAGTTVALVGHTGAGKSTIAKLLARFYDPTEGAITIDGVDLRAGLPGVAATPARHRAAGRLPVRRHRRREPRLRPPGGDTRGDRGRRPAPSEPTSSSSSSRTATTRSSASAAHGCRSASASWSRSPARSSPIRAS